MHNEENKMSPMRNLVSQIASLNGIKDAARIDSQNILVYERELEGNSAFDFNTDDVNDIYNRSWVLFRGLMEVAPDKEKLQYTWDILVLGELSHYKNDEGQTRFEVQITELIVKLAPLSGQYPDIDKVYSLEQAVNEKTWN